MGEFEAEAADLVHLAGEAIAHGATVEALELSAAAATAWRDVPAGCETETACLSGRSLLPPMPLPG